MGRNVRRRAERKAVARQTGRIPNSPTSLQVIVLWGVPSTDKSIFARWLRDQKPFEYLDSDEVARSQRVSGSHQQ